MRKPSQALNESARCKHAPGWLWNRNWWKSSQGSVWTAVSLHSRLNGTSTSGKPSMSDAQEMKSEQYLGSTQSAFGRDKRALLSPVADTSKTPQVRTVQSRIAKISVQLQKLLTVGHLHPTAALAPQPALSLGAWHCPHCPWCQAQGNGECTERRQREAGLLKGPPNHVGPAYLLGNTVFVKHTSCLEKRR